MSPTPAPTGASASTTGSCDTSPRRYRCQALDVALGLKDKHELDSNRISSRAECFWQRHTRVFGGVWRP